MNAQPVQAITWIDSLRKYGKILRISLVERLVYRADFFVTTFFRFLPLATHLRSQGMNLLS